MKFAAVFAGMVLFAGCSSSSQSRPPEPAPAIEKHAAQADESRKMPAENRTSTEVVVDHMFDRPGLPGGTVGHYKKGAKQWDLVLVKSTSPGTAATWLLDYENELDGAKLIPSFGGFFGTETLGKGKGRPVFVFTKGVWLAAVVGLPQGDADLVARDFAARVGLK